MKRLFLSILAVGAGLFAIGQEDAVLLEIDQQPIMVSEFMYIYQKNNQETTIEQKTMDEYLELFINFKLKVAEALSEGIDTTAAFQKELAGYRAQATPKYLRDTIAIDSLVRLSYHRMAHLRRAAHIAIECPPQADDSTKAAALQAIQAARQRVIADPSVDFLQVAREVSTDPSVVDNGGELGWIMPFRYIYAFEDHIYNTPVGQVTEIFSSPYGYHIALVEEEQPTIEVRAAHIMKMVARGDSASIAAKKTEIDSIYHLLLQGNDFRTTAMQTSDDKGSASHGGELKPFTRGMMVRAFENAAFALEPGQMSEPVLSPYGWHIIKMYDKQPIQPFDSLRNDINKKVSRDQRMQLADESFIRKTKAEYHLPDTMDAAAVRAYADKHLEEKYPEFRNLVREYHDGILLFETSLRNVWDKASKDEKGLTNYFKRNKKKYTWDEPRYKGYIIYAKNDTIARQAKGILQHANPDSVESYINHRINKDNLQLVRIEKGLWQKGQVPVVDRDGFKLKDTPCTPDKKLPVTLLVGKLLKAPAEYKDERGQVTSDYQDMLEQVWIEQLKQKHSVVVHQEVIDRLKTEN